MIQKCPSGTSRVCFSHWIPGEQTSGQTSSSSRMAENSRLRPTAQCTVGQLWVRPSLSLSETSHVHSGGGRSICCLTVAPSPVKAQDGSQAPGSCPSRPEESGQPPRDPPPARGDSSSDTAGAGDAGQAAQEARRGHGRAEVTAGRDPEGRGLRAVSAGRSARPGSQRGGRDEADGKVGDLSLQTPLAAQEWAVRRCLRCRGTLRGSAGGS